MCTEGHTTINHGRGDDAKHISDMCMPGQRKAPGRCYLRVLAWAMAESHSRQSLDPLYIKPIFTSCSLFPSSFPFSLYYQHNVQFDFFFPFPFFLSFVALYIRKEIHTSSMHACGNSRTIHALHSETLGMGLLIRIRSGTGKLLGSGGLPS